MPSFPFNVTQYETYFKPTSVAHSITDNWAEDHTTETIIKASSSNMIYAQRAIKRLAKINMACVYFCVFPTKIHFSSNGSDKDKAKNVSK